MKVYNTRKGIIVEHKNKFYQVPERDWDVFTNRTSLYNKIAEELKSFNRILHWTA